MKVFLCGPMGGKPGFNFAMFDRADLYFSERGCEVLNPATFRREEMHIDAARYPTGDFVDDQGWTPQQAFNHTKISLSGDVELLRHADAIAMLPGWDAAFYCSTMLSVAKMMGLSILYPSPCVLQPTGALDDDPAIDASVVAT